MLDNNINDVEIIINLCKSEKIYEAALVIKKHGQLHGINAMICIIISVVNELDTYHNSVLLNYFKSL